MRYVPNPFYAEEVARSVALDAVLKETADSVKSHVEQLAPYDPDDSQPHYVERLESTTAVDDGARRVGRVNAWKYTSGWIEFGTEHMAAQAPLRRGAEAAGLHVIGGEQQ